MNLNNINKDKKYLLAVSGGIDSMVMAHLFLSEQMNFAVAHCNFQLRGEESNGDQALVAQWCKENQIPFFEKRFDTKEYATLNKTSIQETARTFRYNFFENIRHEQNFHLIATAHHQDDSIETMLFHFLRGTGIQGITGIPSQNGHIIRPLIHYSKADINGYALKHQIKYRNDSSNEKEDYTRNKIRNSIIPLLSESFPSLEKSLKENLNRFADAHQIYEQQIQSLTNKLIEQKGNDFYIPIFKLLKHQPLRTILYELIKPFGFSFEQVLETIKIFDSQTGTFIQNQSYRIIKNRNFLIITKQKTEQSDFILIDEQTSNVGGENFNLIISHENYDAEKILKDTTILQIDAEKIIFPILLRKWRQGDYLYPFGMMKKKKVSRVLIDMKMPLHEKENVWILESAQKIIWVIGLKTDERFKINPTSKKLLTIKMITLN